MLTDATWGRRFMKKTTIENAINDYTEQLGDAAQSFQIATLIDIHYAVSRPGLKDRPHATEPPSPPPSYRSGASNSSPASISESRSTSFALVDSPIDVGDGTDPFSSPIVANALVDEPETDDEFEIISDDVLDARGFRRYHQSEVRLRGRANLKGGWWAGVSPAEVEGRPTLIKRYEGPTELALKAWIDDVKLLQNVLVDGSSTMIMGLPPPRMGRWYTARNYGLTESLKMAIMSMLPKGGTLQYKREDDIDNGETTRLISHLVTLIRGLLPADKASIHLPPRVQALIKGRDDDNDDDDDFYRSAPRPNLDLRQLRLSNIDADMHDHTWTENGGIPSHKYAVGDYGYIPDGGKDFDDFVVLGNVLKEGLGDGFAIQNEARGVQWSWKDIPIRHADMEPYPLPGDATCWTMVVLPFAQVDCQVVHSSSFERIADAWRYLLLNGKELGAKHDVRPDELVLITRAGTNQDFYIHDFDSQPPLAGRPNQAFKPVHQPFVQRQGFNTVNPAHGMLNSRFVNPTNPPAIMYLVTSLVPGFEPYWAHSPVACPPGAARPTLRRGWTYKIGWSTGFIDWIQLHPEDFG
ncbi:hypothetical protein H0H87_012949 [Tephrocybe sp. NHM501043]|nr:hypothetical protein H0H87_012949 [Tephrocybe sp. NHM501043]